jgi:arylsulfatase A-like enzyme
MASEEVRQSLATTDEMLGRIVDGVEDVVGRGGYVIVVTADHGQQPDASAVDGYGIDPNEVERDIDAAFGPVSDAVWPTEVFLDDEALEREGVSVEDVARWLGDYRLEDNAVDDVDVAGGWAGSDRLFELAIPARMLPVIECGG